MNSINLDFNKIMIYKKSDFKLKKKKLLNSLVLKYYVKKNVSFSKKKLKNDFYKLFKEFEGISSFIPKIYKINLKYTNKKKKLKTRMFIKVMLNIKREVFNIFDVFFVKYFFMGIKNLEKLKLKKFMYLEEILKNKINFKLKIGCNFLIFNFLALKNVFYFNKIFSKKKKKKFSRKFKSKTRFKLKKNPKLKIFKLINLKLKLKSKNINFFFKLIVTLILNSYKINLFFYKKFLDKKEL